MCQKTKPDNTRKEPLSFICGTIVVVFQDCVYVQHTTHGQLLERKTFIVFSTLYKVYENFFLCFYYPRRRETTKAEDKLTLKCVIHQPHQLFVTDTTRYVSFNLKIKG